MTIIYDLPAAEYHAADLLTSGLLRDFLRSPALYLDRREGHVERKETDAMRFGQVFHAAILEPGTFHARYVAKPDGMSFATKEGKAWREEHADRVIVTHEDWGRCEWMRCRMPDEIAAMLRPGRTEVTVRNTLGGIDAQCRADSWDMTGRMLYDLKSIAAIEQVEKVIWKHRYDVQVRFYQHLIAAETGEKAPSARLIFAETAPPFRWRVVQLDVDYQMRADSDIDSALAGIAAREKSGDWSDPEDLHLVASPPAWLSDDESNDEEE